jgi:hypothetical protein
MDHRAVEDQGRGMVACGGFCPVLVAFSHRLDRFPRQIPESRQGPLDIRSFRVLLALRRFQSIQYRSGEQLVPHTPVRGWLVEEVYRYEQY